ncbi:PREDICTED: uncharacterized protein LOC102842154 [Chrysochloris asiatica]|uniref:Uncharacterized protein LOC102842154 n=1 Tax=Chrysochloris asiatica TaxID=185453 RepID=A0A9B0T6W1_CHRAS|nr:PREDICTED: uncharacterized protein LOC102842154 [Chrysochloris asiatica]
MERARSAVGGCLQPAGAPVTSLPQILKSAGIENASPGAFCFGEEYGTPLAVRSLHSILSVSYRDTPVLASPPHGFRSQVQLRLAFVPPGRCHGCAEGGGRMARVKRWPRWIEDQTECWWRERQRGDDAPKDGGCCSGAGLRRRRAAGNSPSSPCSSAGQGQTSAAFACLKFRSPFFKAPQGSLHLRRTTEQHVPEVEVQVKRRRSASLSIQECQLYPRRSQQQVPVVDFQAELRQAFLSETPRGG